MLLKELNMLTNKKLILLCFVFAFFYLLVLQQALLLLTDYTMAEISSLYKNWQTYCALFIFNLLVVQTTQKYFKNSQNVYLPITIGFSSAVLPIFYAYSISDVWVFLLVNIVVFAIALFVHKLLEKLYRKSNQDGNN
jgi:Na+-driven multidrug efflux pump